jgi:type IX secretion system PorP/SprF family membrane protein
MLKKITLTLFLFAPLCVRAQQEQMYTQFALNKLPLNPGYAGSFASPTLTAVFRKQWTGIEGAPDAQVVSYHQPTYNNQLGLGGSISRQSIGISNTLTLDMAFAYKIRMKRGILAVGMQASVRNFRQNWADPRIYAIDQNDLSIPVQPGSKFMPNFGTGLYYTAYKDKWYAGIALPRMIRNNTDFSEYGNVFSREVHHVNAMGGFSSKVNDEMTLHTQVLFRYAVGAPFDFELNTSALLRKKFYGGLTYRAGGNIKGAGESVDALLGIQANENLFFCVSYDIGISRLRKASNGTVELTARWWFSPPDDVDSGKIDSGRPF